MERNIINILNFNNFVEASNFDCNYFISHQPEIHIDDFETNLERKYLLMNFRFFIGEVELILSLPENEGKCYKTLRRKYQNYFD
jgi:hypothetical protein